MFIILSVFSVFKIRKYQVFLIFFIVQNVIYHFGNSEFVLYLFSSKIRFIFLLRLLNLNLFLLMPYLLGSKLSYSYWVSCKRNSWHYNITCIHKKKINLAAVTFPSSKSCNSCGSYWRFILCGVILKGTEKINSVKRIII